MIETNESMTAKICSWVRANHSINKKNKKKIFNDFLAYALMGNDEYKKSEQRFKFLNDYVCPIVLPRIAYAESRLCRFLNQNKYIQYVILGAGMDTFSLRNRNKNIDIFELDHPLTQNYKRKKIKQAGFKEPSNTHFISIDFEKENIKDLLYESSFDFNKPTFFSFLGVAYYLTLKSFENTIESISKCSKNNIEFVFDFPDKTEFKNNRTQILSDITALMGEPMQKELEFFEIKKIFERYGFKTANYMTPNDIQKKYLMNISNLTAYENIYFISAVK